MRTNRPAARSAALAASLTLAALAWTTPARADGPPPGTVSGTLTETQRQMLLDCEQASVQLEQAANSIVRATKKMGFSPTEVRKLRDEALQHARTMEQRHVLFVQSLGETQKQQVRTILAELAKTTEQLASRLSALDEQVDQLEPSRDRIQKQAGDLAKIAKKWRKQSQKIASGVGISS